MSGEDVLDLLLLTGAGITLIAFPLLFAKRYPRRPAWLLLGILMGLVAMFLWPLTIWVALGLWLSGFARPQAPSAQQSDQQQIASELVQAQAYAHQAELESMPMSAAYWHAEIRRLMAQMQQRSSEGRW